MFRVTVELVSLVPRLFLPLWVCAGIPQERDTSQALPLIELLQAQAGRAWAGTEWRAAGGASSSLPLHFGLSPGAVLSIVRAQQHSWLLPQVVKTGSV